MNFQQPIHTLSELGAFFKQAAQEQQPVFRQAYLENNWFTETYVQKAVLAWADELTPAKLQKWLGAYASMQTPEPKKVAIIMAGNIPLVGLHDLLAVLACGHEAVVKLSSDDKQLMKWAIEALQKIDIGLKSRIQIVDSRLPELFDAVIATGSNNTNRYFQYYFKNKPSLLRKARHSVAVLTGNETPEDMMRLGEDIFTYFGLGCRNVAKLYVPEGYDVSHFYEGIASFHEHINHHKYANNYTYHKAILLMNLTPHLDNNFLLLKEDNHIASPLGVMFYEHYKNESHLNDLLNAQKEAIQCIVAKQQITAGSVPLGKAQEPALSDYADGIDTIQFLMNL